MQLLNHCLELKGKIDLINDRIADIESKLSSPKNQIISDMPRGGGGGESITDKLLDRKWALTEKKVMYEAELNSKWIKIHKALNGIGATEEQIVLFQLRFREGLLWKDCQKYMQKHYGDTWNENKVYRVNRTLLSKMHKIEKESPWYFR